MKGPRLAACAQTRWGKTAVLAALLLSGGALPAAAREEEEYTKEWGASLGMNSLLDDTNSSVFGNPHLSMGASMRFLFNPRMALRTEMGVHFVSGDTGGVKDFYPDYVDRVGTARRFYRYSGTVFDLAALYELNFFSYAYRPGYQGHRRFTPYLQTGLGFAFPTTGRTVTPWVPIGVGVKYKLRPRLNVGLDWTMRFSLSDRLDGFDAPHGLQSDFFRNQDHLGLLRITITYDFAPKCPTCNKAD